MSKEKFIKERELKIETLEKTLLLYMLFRNELELKLKADLKIGSETQLHDYALNKLIDEDLI